MSEVKSNTSPLWASIPTQLVRLWFGQWLDFLLVAQTFSSHKSLLPCHLTGWSCWQCLQRQQSGPSVGGCSLPAPPSTVGFSSDRCGRRETEPPHWADENGIVQTDMIIELWSEVLAGWNRGRRKKGVFLCINRCDLCKTEPQHWGGINVKEHHRLNPPDKIGTY